MARTYEAELAFISGPSMSAWRVPQQGYSSSFVFVGFVVISFDSIRERTPDFLQVSWGSKFWSVYKLS
jgi:hypothetical protein